MIKLLPILLALALLTPPAFVAAAPPVAVRLLLSNPAPYVGEEVVLTLEVRYRQHPGGRLSLRWPQPDSCLADDLTPLPPRREESGDGTLVVETARRRLRPLVSGRLPLAGGILLRGELVTAAPLALRVRPLPVVGRPEGFGGAVGTVVLELRAEGAGTREVAAVLHGNAPLDAFPAPQARTAAGERLIPLGDTLAGETGERRERVFRYLYLPGEGRRGRLAFSLPVFDPATGRYQMLQATLPREPAVWPALLPAVAALLLAGSLLPLVALRRRQRTLDAVLARALGRLAAGLCRERIVHALRRAGARPETIAALQQLWAEEDRARFGPVPAGTQTTVASRRRDIACALANDVDKSRRIP